MALHFVQIVLHQISDFEDTVLDPLLRSYLRRFVGDYTDGEKALTLLQLGKLGSDFKLIDILDLYEVPGSSLQSYLVFKHGPRVSPEDNA